MTCKTARYRKTISAPTKWIIERGGLKDSDILHHGEGKARVDTIALRYATDKVVVPYDPNSDLSNINDPAIMNQRYDFGISNYVFNTLPIKYRNEAWRKLKEVCTWTMVTVRTDKIIGREWQDGVLMKNGAFQKSYTKEEAATYFKGRIVNDGGHYVTILSYHSHLK